MDSEGPRGGGCDDEGVCAGVLQLSQQSTATSPLGIRDNGLVHQKLFEAPEDALVLDRVCEGRIPAPRVRGDRPDPIGEGGASVCFFFFVGIKYTIKLLDAHTHTLAVHHTHTHTIAMPKATHRGAADTWQTCPVPQTPLQRGAFIDLCTQWLVLEPSSVSTSPPLVPRTTWVPPVASSRTAPATAIGLTRDELRMAQRRMCGFCDAEEGVRATVANPFTQRPLVMACTSCMP